MGFVIFSKKVTYNGSVQKRMENKKKKRTNHWYSSTEILGSQIMHVGKHMMVRKVKKVINQCWCAGRFETNVTINLL